jgi:hypothetical protein
MYPVDTAPNCEKQAPVRPKSPRKMRHGVTPRSAPPLVPKIADYQKTLPPQCSEVEPSQRLKRGFFDFQRRPAVALVYTLDSHHKGAPSLPASRPGPVKTVWDGSGTGGVALTRRHSARSEESGRSGRFEAGPNLSSSGREAATGNNAGAGRGQNPSPLEAIEKLLAEPLPNRIAITPHARIARCWAFVHPELPMVVLDNVSDFHCAAKRLSSLAVDIELLNTEDGMTVEQTIVECEKFTRQLQQRFPALVIQ